MVSSSRGRVLHVPIKSTARSFDLVLSVKILRAAFGRANKERSTPIDPRAPTRPENGSVRIADRPAVCFSLRAPRRNEPRQTSPDSASH